MAGTSLLALIDDIAGILDDVAAMSKIAAKKTVGVLGDDLALNANQVAGVNADRELPIVWAVARGSLVNKAILVPAALLISGVMPWAIMPLLMLGGAYLCFEGIEKILHTGVSTETTETIPLQPPPSAIDEQEKIKGAVRTDFILSAEIIVITLGTVAGATLVKQFAVLAAIALAMTIGVYGLVAAIVKFDDVGLYWLQRSGEKLGDRLLRVLGSGILRAAPLFMKTLSIVGTAAMFLVGGGILLHGVPAASTWGHTLQEAVASQGWGELLQAGLNGLAGLIAGAVLLGLNKAVMSIRKRLRRSS